MVVPPESLVRKMCVLHTLIMRRRGGCQTGGRWMEHCRILSSSTGTGQCHIFETVGLLCFGSNEIYHSSSMQGNHNTGYCAANRRCAAAEKQCAARMLTGQAKSAD